MKYKIFAAFDHFKGIELFQVIGINNDYIGEYHKTIDEALQELGNLKLRNQ